MAIKITTFILIREKLLQRPLIDPVCFLTQRTVQLSFYLDRIEMTYLPIFFPIRWDCRDELHLLELIDVGQKDSVLCSTLYMYIILWMPLLLIRLCKCQLLYIKNTSRTMNNWLLKRKASFLQFRSWFI